MLIIDYDEILLFVCTDQFVITFKCLLTGSRLKWKYYIPVIAEQKAFITCIASLSVWVANKKA